MVEAQDSGRESQTSSCWEEEEAGGGVGSGKRRHGNEGESSISKKRPDPRQGLNFWRNTPTKLSSRKKKSIERDISIPTLNEEQSQSLPWSISPQSTEDFPLLQMTGCQYVEDYWGSTLRCSSLLFFLPLSSLSLSPSSRSLPGLLSQRGGF